MMRSMVDAAVQRAEHEVAGLRRFDRDRHGLEIAHFADQHHVRILPQRGAKRLLEPAGVETDLALRDDAALARMHELDRILDREDVVRARAIHEVHHRGQRGGLA